MKYETDFLEKMMNKYEMIGEMKELFLKLGI